MRTFLALSTAAVFVVLACDDFGSDGENEPSDAGASLDAPADPGDAGEIELRDADTTLPPETQTCIDKPFGEPVLVTGIPSQALCFTLTPDEKQAFFNADGTLFSAPFDGKVFGPATALSVAKSTERVGCVTFNATGTMLFVEDFFRVFRQTRLPDGGYGQSKEIPPAGLVERRYISTPFVDRTTSELYVGVGRIDAPLDAPFGIARAPIKSNGDVGPFTSVEVGDPDAHNPVLSADGRALYYSSAKDSGAASSEDIWVATRASPNDAFSGAQRIDAVNSIEGDAPLYLSRDGCRLYLVSLRDALVRKLFVATRQP